jgi:choline kinase
MILAAGEGRRLEDRRRRPKCLHEVGGVPLVHHQLTALATVDITDVVIVVGFGQEQIRESVGKAARYVVNNRFAETNSMYSFLLGQLLVDDDVVVMNSDVFCHPGMLQMLADVDGDALLYDSGSGAEAEQMKVQVAAGRLVRMAKDLPPTLVDGENVGVLRLSRRTADDMVGAAARVVASGRERAWLATAVNEVAGDHPITCLDAAGWPWVEIDFREDLRRARAEVFPAVAHALEALEPRYVLSGLMLRSVS